MQFGMHAKKKKNSSNNNRLNCKVFKSNSLPDKALSFSLFFLFWPKGNPESSCSRYRDTDTFARYNFVYAKHIPGRRQGRQVSCFCPSHLPPLLSTYPACNCYPARTPFHSVCGCLWNIQGALQGFLHLSYSQACGVWWFHELSPPKDGFRLLTVGCRFWPGQQPQMAKFASEAPLIATWNNPRRTPRIGSIAALSFQPQTQSYQSEPLEHNP